MKGSKLLDILSTFSKKEMKSFEKLISSPYAKIERDVTGLFDILKEYYPDFEDSNLEKEKIYKILSPGENFNSKKLTNIAAELTRLAEKFLVYEHIDSDAFDYERFLSIQYLDRKKEKLFSRSIRALEKKIEGSLIDSVDLFSREEKVVRLKEEYHIMRNDFDNAMAARRQYDEYITLSFLVIFLRSMRNKLQVKDIHKGSPDSMLFDTMSGNIDFENLLDELKKSKYPDLWIVELYYCCFLCTRYPDDDASFRKFMKLFYDNMNKFSHREKYFLFCDIVSFCIRNENRGNTSYAREEMKVYKTMMEKEIFTSSEKDYMSLMLFRNAMLLAISLREYEWLDKFIDNYSVRLKPDYVDNMRVFARAHLDFELGNFEAALDNITKIKYDLFAYKIDVKNLFLKVFYELELFDQAFSMVDTYKQYLKNNQEFSPAYKLQFKNFNKLYLKLLKARADNKHSGLDNLADEINSTETLSTRSWLLEKINEMKK